jgi:hypothetical protein
VNNSNAGKIISNRALPNEKIKLLAAALITKRKTNTLFIVENSLLQSKTVSLLYFCRCYLHFQYPFSSK